MMWLMVLVRIGSSARQLQTPRAEPYLDLHVLDRTHKRSTAPSPSPTASDHPRTQHHHDQHIMRPTSKGIPNREVANLKWDDVPIQYRPRTRSRTKPPSIVEDPELALRVLRELDSDHEERERIPSAPRVRGERPPIPHVKDIFRPPGTYSKRAVDNCDVDQGEGETPPRKHRQSRNFSTPSPRTNREMEDVSENSGGTVVHRHRGPREFPHTQPA